MSKFLSGRQSNLKLGVAGYTESKTVLETTGKVGIGTTDAQQHSLFVVGSTNITGDTSVGGDLSVAGTSSLTGDTTVGSAITMYASSGIVSATAFYGDGSNLENTGATLSAAAGTQRLVVTSLTSGTMVDAATDSDLTYNATTDTLNVENIDVDGHTELDQLRVTGVSTFAGNVDISSNGNLTVAGNLIVQGTETRLNTTALEVEDINIGIASADPKLSNASLDGAGITIYGSAGDKTLTWSNANSRMEFNTNLYSPNFFVGGITATGDVDFDGNLDVDGHTELDQLRVSGVSTFQSDIHLGDSDKINLGDNDDFQIFHHSNGTGIIQNAGSGQLQLRSDEIRLLNQATDEDYAFFRDDGAVELYYDNSKKFETTGIGVSIYNDLNVGTAVTVYGNAGIVSAISFYGDGSNLTNTGATLSATSGIERLVTTQLTSGTMVDAATDADLTFNAANNLLTTPKIEVLGLSPDGITFGPSGYVPLADGAGGWSWANLQGASAVNTILNGFTVSEEGVVVGTAGSITQLDFRGVNVLASADPAPNGIATVSILLNQSLDSLDVSGIATFRGPVSNGSTTGNAGQYLQSTGVGVTWASFPTLRVVGINTANAGQSTFNFSYNVDFLDVFVNGVKLTPSEYTATNGNQIILSTPAFADEIVEFHSYNITSNYGGGGGGGGGASNLTGLTDVTISSLTDKDLLQYQSSSGEWENVSVNSLPYATEAFVGLATAGLTNEAFVGLSTAGLASEAFVGLSTAGLASEAFVGLATAGLLTAHQSLIGKANVTIGDNPPGIGTASGDLWWESDTAKGHIYYDDGSSAQWVEFNPSSGGGGGGGGGSYGNADVDSHLNVSGASSGQILSWNGSDYAWVADQTGGGGGGGISTHDVRTNSLEVYTGVSTFVGYAATFAAQFKNNVFIDAGAYAMFGNSIDKFSIRNTVGKSQLISGQNGGNVEILSQQSGSVIKIGKYSGGANDIALFTVDAGVELFHNTAKKFETTGTGVNITDTLNVAGISTFNNVKIVGSGSNIEFTSSSNSGSSQYMKFWVGNQSGTHYATIDGSGGAFQIHNTSHPTGTLDFRAKEDYSFQVNGYYSILNQSNGGVKLYHPGSQGNILSQKFETTAQGAIVTGILTATSFVKSGGTSSQYLMADGSVSVGAGSTDLVTTWTLGANGSSHYTFTGPGVAPATDDPTIYLVRGQTYKFENRSGGHPFRIQYEFQNTGGTAYNDGIVNNAAGNGTDLYWEVRNDAPDLLHYQCTAHGGMSGRIVILGDVVSSGSWTASAGTAQTIDTITGVANNAIKTAEYTIHIENGSNMQAQKVLVMQDGTTAFSQEYAIMHKSGLLVSMSATISGGNLLLQATPETGVTGTTTYKVTRQTMR